MAGNTNSSTLTVQQLVDYARTYPWTIPTLGIAGYSDSPAVQISDDIAKKILCKANPWKWNQYPFPTFYTQPYQQDYPTSVSQNTLGWLHSATMTDINNGNAPLPQPPMTVVQSLLPSYACDIPTKICWITNSMAQLGVWGGSAIIKGTSNPGPGSVYTNPVNNATTGLGGPNGNPLTAILDTNGNIQVVTQYGTCGNNQPIWPAANAAAGTITNDGSVQWTVQDPNGVALRLNFIATNSSTVWQINASYQQKPITITSIGQTFAPIPDDLSYLIRQGFLAFLYKHAGKKEFSQEYAQWEEAIQMAMGASDRELQEFGFYPENSIQGGSGGSGAGANAYPGWPGWS